MTQPLRIEHLDETLRASGQIEGQHALQLRRMIYANGSVTRKDAEILFKLDLACSRKDASFAALYVEALTDYFVWQSDPKGYVTPELGRFLIENVAGDGHVSRKTELELVLNVVHWARAVPGEVSDLVLKAVRESVLLSRPMPVGANRPKACICAGDVAILRKALHAPAGDGSLAITRREAELLFSLNEATPACDNDPAWRDFFVRAIASHLTNSIEAPVTSPHDEAGRRERWLEERGVIGNMLSAVAAAFARGDVPFMQVWAEFDPTGALAGRRAVEAEAKAARTRLARETLDQGEAKWVADRILRDGAVDENERALLAFLKREARAIDPALEPVMKRAGL